MLIQKGIVKISCTLKLGYSSDPVNISSVEKLTLKCSVKNKSYLAVEFISGPLLTQLKAKDTRDLGRVFLSPVKTGNKAIGLEAFRSDIRSSYARIQLR